MERQESQYDELFAAPAARIGEVLRIRLPNDFIVSDNLFLLEENAPLSIWSRMVNSLLTIAQVTREAVGLLRLQIRPSGLTDEANTRSLELLRSWLSSEQLASFERSGSFEVRGGRSGRRYLLRSKYSFGIEVLEGREKGLQLCVVPQGAPALGDILLAQKIGLERCEFATLAKANKWRPEELAV